MRQYFIQRSVYGESNIGTLYWAEFGLNVTKYNEDIKWLQQFGDIRTVRGICIGKRFDHLSKKETTYVWWSK